MLTMKKAFNEVIPKNASDIFSSISEIWGRNEGNAHIIRQKLSPQLFNVHVCSMVIDMSQGEGWYEIIANNPQMLKYIPQVMSDFGYSKLGQSVKDLIDLFPSIATFEYDDLHFAIVNFLENERRKITDERLSHYTKEERAELSDKYKNLLGVLDDLSEEHWGDVSQGKAWDVVLDYISKHFDD